MTVSISHYWPQSLMELAEVVGPEAALAIAREFGGRGVYVPHTAYPGHIIEQVIGRGAFERLCKYHGGEELRDIPLAAALENKSALIRATARNYPDLSHRAIAAALRTTERHVRRVLNGEDGPVYQEQLTMFEMEEFEA